VSTEHLFRTLCLFNLFGNVSWVEINAGLGWLLTARRVLLLLAICVRAGWIRPQKSWFEPHELTSAGHLALESILASMSRKSAFAVEDLLRSDEEQKLAFGGSSWAGDFAPEYLLTKLVSGRERISTPEIVDSLSQISSEDVDLEIELEKRMLEEMLK